MIRPAVVMDDSTTKRRRRRRRKKKRRRRGAAVLLPMSPMSGMLVVQRVWRSWLCPIMLRHRKLLKEGGPQLRTSRQTKLMEEGGTH